MRYDNRKNKIIITLLQVQSLNIKMKYHNNPVELVKTAIKLDVDMKNEKEHG